MQKEISNFINSFPIKEYASFYKNIFINETENLSSKEKLFCLNFKKLPEEYQNLYINECKEKIVKTISKK